MNNILQPRNSYRPFLYPWAEKAWEMQQSIHWWHGEIKNMMEDRKDWFSFDEHTKDFYLHILSYFTQSDINVRSVYSNQYKELFPHPEVEMMLASFENMETCHIRAYEYLLVSLGYDFQEYVNYPIFKAKENFFESYTIDPKDPVSIALGLAAYGAFTEGYQLYSNFAVLMSPAQVGKLRNVKKIVEWSLRDEALHTNSIIELYKTVVRENKIKKSDLGPKLVECARIAYDNEIAFIDHLYSIGNPLYLPKGQLKDFMTDLHALRCRQIGINPIETSERKMQEVLPWFFRSINLAAVDNFFESTISEYSK